MQTMMLINLWNPKRLEMNEIKYVKYGYIAKFLLQMVYVVQMS